MSEEEAPDRYEVEYTYYQYNSGAADNGTYRATAIRRTAKEAVDLAAAMNRLAANRDDMTEEDRDIVRENIPWDGYFLGARAYAVSKSAISPEASTRRP